MGWLKKRIVVVPATMVLLVSALGASLGLVAALRAVTLYQGVNYQGPSGGQVISPEKFVSCLGTNWSAVYRYDTAQERWFHYFPEGTGAGQVPAWVNSPSAGGFNQIPVGAGLAIIMKTQMNNAVLLDRSSEVCP